MSTTTEDRGDDFTPSPEELAEEEARLASEAAKQAKEAAASSAKPEEKLEAEPETKHEAKPEHKDTRIPLSRHEEILRKERERSQAIATQLATIQRGTQAAASSVELSKLEHQVSELDEQYAKLVADGQLPEANKVMIELRQTERAISTARIEAASSKAYTEALAAARYDTACDRIEAAWPELNTNAPEFDKDKSAEVFEMIEAWKARGYTPVDALQKSVRYVMGEPKTPSQASSVEVAPNATPKEKVEAERKAAAVSKALKAAGKTPASLEKVGIDSERLGQSEVSAKDISKMSQKQFAELSDATLSKLRGDEFEA